MKYKLTETSIIEFKEKVDKEKPKNWLKSVSAFSNGKGGTIVFGINDKKRTLIGIDNIIKDTETISQLINSRITPIPTFNINTFKEGEKEYIELKIEGGEKTPYYYTHNGSKETFIRSGNESIPTPKHILENLILKGQNLTYDELSSKYKINDLSFTLLNATLKKNMEKGIDDEKDLISLKLLDKENFITNARVLLSDQGLISHSRIFCTRWKG